MARYIGVDLGTTSITALLLDTESKLVLAKEALANKTEITTPEDRSRGRSEWDLERMVTLTFGLLSRLMGGAGNPPVMGLGVTGQQHGMALLDRSGRPCTPFIGWQDRRCHDRLPGGETYLEWVQALGGNAWSGSEYPLPVRGYMGSTLFWLSQNNLLPANTLATFAADYLASRLCGTEPLTDPTNAAGAGIFDVVRGCWNEELISRLDLDRVRLPRVRPACTWAGTVNQTVARKTGLPAGLPVTVACGDNQASFAGSVADYDQSVLINIGTGGQISVYLKEPIRIKGLLLRPFVQPGFLLVGAGLGGGRTYRVLQQFMQQVGEQVFGLSEWPDLYDRLNQLAGTVPAGSGGLCCEPLFTGSLQEPDRRGTWSGISDTNFTPGHLTRSLLEGLAEQFRGFYQTMQERGINPRSQLIGAGNGIRKNPLLGQILAAAFGLPLKVVQHPEEAAVGAALCASVGAGEYLNIEAAGCHFISYFDHG